MHTLRHTAAMRLLHAGVDIAVIALWLGHETLATTHIYLHADMTQKERAIATSPSPALVISAVRAPSRAARSAAITPAGPPPMTTTSRLSRLEEAIPASIRAVLMLLPARSRRVASAALWKVWAAVNSSYARDEAGPGPGDNEAPRTRRPDELHVD